MYLLLHILFNLSPHTHSYYSPSSVLNLCLCLSVSPLSLSHYLFLSISPLSLTLYLSLYISLTLYLSLSIFLCLSLLSLSLSISPIYLTLYLSLSPSLPALFLPQVSWFIYLLQIHTYSLSPLFSPSITEFSLPQTNSIY